LTDVRADRWSDSSRHRTRRHYHCLDLAAARSNRRVASTARFVRSYKLGFPLGEPNNAALQLRIIAEALSLLSRDDVPVIEDFQAALPA